MRLEDWQKWLDAQFVDTQDEPRAETLTEEAATLPVGEERSVYTWHAPQTARTTEIADVAKARETAEAPAIEESSDAHAAAEDEAIPVEAAYRAPEPRADPPAPARPAVLPLGEEDGDVPSIENYLPFLRAKRDTADETDSTGSSEQPVTQYSGSAVEARSNGVPVEQQAPVNAVAETAEPLPPARRFGPTNRRSRHGKHLTPRQAAPPMPAEEVWNLVPRHLRTLMAMSGDEVAQHSYKRDFRESRVDLIQRLLDPTLTLEETARLLNVCPTTVRRYTNRGLLRHMRTAGDQRRFKLSDVLAFLETQSQPGPAP